MEGTLVWILKGNQRKHPNLETKLWVCLWRPLFSLAFREPNGKPEFVGAPQFDTFPDAVMLKTKVGL